MLLSQYQAASIMQDKLDKKGFRAGLEPASGRIRAGYSTTELPEAGPMLRPFFYENNHRLIALIHLPGLVLIGDLKESVFTPVTNECLSL